MAEQVTDADRIEALEWMMEIVMDHLAAASPEMKAALIKDLEEAAEDLEGLGSEGAAAEVSAMSNSIIARPRTSHISDATD